MSLVSAEQAIAHVRGEGVETTDSVALYLGAAERAALNFINRNVYKDAAALAAAVETGEAGEGAIVVDDAIRAAILLIFGHLYANREENVTGTIVSDLKIGAKFLLQPYRLGMGI